MEQWTTTTNKHSGYSRVAALQRVRRGEPIATERPTLSKYLYYYLLNLFVFFSARTAYSNTRRCRCRCRRQHLSPLNPPQPKGRASFALQLDPLAAPLRRHPDYLNSDNNTYRLMPRHTNIIPHQYVSMDPDPLLRRPRPRHQFRLTILIAG